MCTTGVHIFDKNSAHRAINTATDSFFIYTVVDCSESYTDFIRKLRVENHFNERCGKLNMENYEIELTVLENRRCVIVNASAWPFACKKIVNGDAELHGKKKENVPSFESNRIDNKWNDMA